MLAVEVLDRPLRATRYHSDRRPLLALSGRIDASAIRSPAGDKTDVKCSVRACPLLTQIGHWPKRK
jgi:hypothetical protein